MSDVDQNDTIEQAEKQSDNTSSKQESGQNNAAEMAARLAQLEKELSDAHDKEKRAQADLANMLRRKDQEKELALKFAHLDFLKEFLFILDTIDSGIMSLKQPQTSVESVLQGLELLERQIEQLTEKFDMTVIMPEVGTPFDHRNSEAMSMQENKQYPSNSVLMVIQKGYEARGRLLRPARVIVSKNESGS
jgi:molecular chaperone GrpE